MKKEGKNPSNVSRLHKEDVHHLKALKALLPPSLTWCDEDVGIGNRVYRYFEVEKGGLKKVSQKSLKTKPDSFVDQALHMVGDLLAAEVPLHSFDVERNYRILDGDRLVILPDSALSFAFEVSCRALAKFLEPFIEYGKCHGAVTDGFVLAQDIYAKLALDQLPAVKQVLRDHSFMSEKRRKADAPVHEPRVSECLSWGEIMQALANHPIYRPYCVDENGDLKDTIEFETIYDSELGRACQRLICTTEKEVEESVVERLLCDMEVESVSILTTHWEIETWEQRVDMGLDDEDEDFFPIPEYHVLLSHEVDIQTYTQSVYRTVSLKRKIVYVDREVPWEDF